MGDFFFGSGYIHGHRVISLVVFYFHGGKQEGISRDFCEADWRECHVTLANIAFRDECSSNGCFQFFMLFVSFRPLISILTKFQVVLHMDVPARDLFVTL